MQLDACLRSFYMHCRDAARCRARVIYTCSTERHKAQYAVLRDTYDSVEFICENVFYSDLIAALEGSEHVLFLVDDNIFVRGWSLHETLGALEKNPSALGFSLRLGRNTTYCYSLNRQQSLPEFEGISSRIMNFRWVDAEYEFGYPLEISSSIFRTDQLLPMLCAAPAIRSPNTLEARLNVSKDLFQTSHPDLLCFVDSVAFCNPANVVQTDHYNRSSVDSRFTAYHLMRRFDLGYRIDISRLANFVPRACHQEIDFEYQPPIAEWDSISVAVQLHSASQGAPRQGALENAGHTKPETSISSNLDIASLPDESKVQVLEFICLVEASYRSSNREWLLDLLKGIGSVTDGEQLDAARLLGLLKTQLEEIQKREDDWYKPELVRYQNQLNERLKVESDWYRPELARYQRELAEAQAELGKSQAELGQIKGSRAWAVAQKLKFLHSRLNDLLRLLRTNEIRLVATPACEYISTNLAKLTWLGDALRQRRVTARSKSTPRVSVILPVYNGDRYLAESISSILGQTFTGFELIIIDDGSSDRTGKIIEEFRVNDPRIVVVHHRKNKGIVYSLNEGLRYARADLIARQDADDISYPNRIAEQVAYLSHHPEIGLLGTAIDVVNGDGKSTEIYRLPETDAQIRFRLLFNSAFAHPSVMFRAAVILNYQLRYSPNFPHAEDYELWVRMLQHTKAHNLPMPLVKYRVSSNNASRTFVAEQVETANDISAKYLRELNAELSLSWETKCSMLELYRNFANGQNTCVSKRDKTLASQLYPLITTFLEKLSCDDEQLLLFKNHLGACLDND